MDPLLRNAEAIGRCEARYLEPQDNGDPCPKCACEQGKVLVGDEYEKCTCECHMTREDLEAIRGDELYDQRVDK